MNMFFYENYSKRGYNSVKRWIKNDLFGYQLCLIHIHIADRRKNDRKKYESSREEIFKNHGKNHEIP